MVRIIRFAVLLVLSFPFLLPAQAPNFDILPLPNSVFPRPGAYKLTPYTVFEMPDGYAPILPAFLEKSAGIKFKIPTESDKKTANRNLVRYVLLPQSQIPAEGYRLSISKDRIQVEAASATGLLYAEQTLMQLWQLNRGVFPAVEIEDEPRFAWRGMHLDESRHFMGKAFVKKYLDLLFSLKMNVFHWHLTDATGWRIEIKKYPKLTSVGAWRPDRPNILYADADTARSGEAMTYGGFYTQAEIREIVAYAAERKITVIPEIEMPGHTTAALVAYPEYSCSGGPFPMPGGAKNCPYPNYCVGNEQTYGFLENILTEVMALFPSQYIHIGGDEVDRSQWSHCMRCQGKMRELGYTDAAKLQVWFTKRIETFIRSKGRQLMGWDEIMEGGDLTPSSGVMVWRGEPLVREATAAGHDAVIAHNYYFDLYQGNPKFEPPTYGYLLLERVYSYEPVPENLTEDQKKHILGVHGCLWTENVYDTQQAEYMLLPRLFALAEVAWTPANRRSWTDFSRRMPGYMEQFTARGFRVATSIYDPELEIWFDSTAKTLAFSIKQQVPTGEINYTTDGRKPDSSSSIYTAPVPLSAACTIAAAVFKNGEPISKTLSAPYSPTLASGKPFVLKTPPNPKYNGKRPETLTDGMMGGEVFHEGNWCGFYGDDLDITIDLGAEQPLDRVTMNWLEITGSWIYLPTNVTVFISKSGQDFDPVFAADQGQITAANPRRIKPLTAPLQGKVGRFVRVVAKNPGQHPVYADGKCWIFIDEIGVFAAP